MIPWRPGAPHVFHRPPRQPLFRDYRRRGGTRTSTLPDFFIGAHAAVAGLTLLTRDARRYRTYFPRLRIIAPTS